MKIIQKGNDNAEINLPDWKRVYFGNIFKEENSSEKREIINAYVPQREASLIKLFEMKGRIGFNGIDLLWKLLNLNPHERISAETALQHPFFDTIRQ